jgi:hypothetical protein
MGIVSRICRVRKFLIEFFICKIIIVYVDPSNYTNGSNRLAGQQNVSRRSKSTHSQHQTPSSTNTTWAQRLGWLPIAAGVGLGTAVISPAKQHKHVTQNGNMLLVAKSAPTTPHGSQYDLNGDKLSNGE